MGGERSLSPRGSVATGKSWASQLGSPQFGGGSGDSDCVLGYSSFDGIWEGLPVIRRRSANTMQPIVATVGRAGLCGASECGIRAVP